MMECEKCKEFFNPSCLSEVVEHMHGGAYIDKEYYGKKIQKNPLLEALKEENVKKENSLV